MDLLARREHSAFELKLKLMQRGADEATIAPVLAQLAKEHLLSDQRFAEAYTRMRMRSGMGPIRIRQELQAKRVNEALIDATLAAVEDDWLPLIERVYQKKYGAKKPQTFAEKMKRRKFLEYRGFSDTHIGHLQQLC